MEGWTFYIPGGGGGVGRYARRGMKILMSVLSGYENLFFLFGWGGRWIRKSLNYLERKKTSKLPTDLRLEKGEKYKINNPSDKKPSYQPLPSV